MQDETIINGAMDEQAKRIAMAFGKYISENDYYRVKSTGYWFKKGFSHYEPPLTDDELYHQFKFSLILNGAE